MAIAEVVDTTIVRHAEEASEIVADVTNSQKIDRLIRASTRPIRQSLLLLTSLGTTLWDNISVSRHFLRNFSFWKSLVQYLFTNQFLWLVFQRNLVFIPNIKLLFLRTSPWSSPAFHFNTVFQPRFRQLFTLDSLKMLWVKFFKCQVYRNFINCVLEVPQFKKGW